MMLKVYRHSTICKIILIRVYFYFTHLYGEFTSHLALVRLLRISPGTKTSNALGLKILERNDSPISVINCSSLVKPVGILVSGAYKMIVDHEEIYSL
jgi:hypothetical protein